MKSRYKIKILNWYHKVHTCIRYSACVKNYWLLLLTENNVTNEVTGYYTKINGFFEKVVLNMK
jgi:hypothetical protein